MTPFHPPAKPSREEKEKEKKGSGAWAPGAGASGGLELAGGASSPVATIATTPLSQLGALLNLLTKATGLSAVAASKFGLLALLLAGGTIAAAISLLTGGDTASTPATKPSFGTVFQRGQAPAEGAAASAAAEAPAGIGPSALDYFSSANAVPDELADGAEPEAPGLLPRGAAAAAKVAVPAPSKPAAATALLEKPKMKASKGLGGGSAAASQVALKVMPSLSGKVGGGFQDIYRRGQSGNFGASRAAPPPSRSMSAVIQRSGAFDQARSVAKVSRRAAEMSAAEGASTTASSAFDASARRGSNLGSTLSNAGKPTSANSVQDVDEIGLKEPPSPAKNASNQTPYQGLIYAGMAALMAGQMLVQAASKMADNAQKNPANAPQLYAAANALALAAMGAGGAAAAIGGALASNFKQQSQAIPYIVGGLVLIAQAAIVLIMTDIAAAQAASGIDAAAASGASDSSNALGGGMPPIPSNNNSDNKPSPPPPKPKPKISINVQDTGNRGGGSADPDHLPSSGGLP